ncbi:hypothetical protein N0V90_005336 [Kalmusia sp. IMI 367209]|nr:hypothetical protein N0V90_005336 [Kalmusia sp. IMI 367209]
MRLLSFLCGLVAVSTSTILENGHVRETRFLDTKVASITKNSTGWKTYGPDATELSYKGRWDDKHISWWAAPGLKFAFSGQNLAITFGNFTTNGVLIAYRVSGLDWQLSNITAGATHQLVSPSTPGLNATLPSQLPLTFELRVTNWAYGVQISAVHVSSAEKLIKIPDFARRIEFIGDSLMAGYSASYEAFSGFGYTIGAGLGNVEFSVTAYPGICLHDADCWGNPRGQEYQFHRTVDTSPRALSLYNQTPPLWDFTAHPYPDIVVINIGTNDNNTATPPTREEYLDSYLKFIPTLHKIYPNAQIVLMSLWNGFNARGSSYREAGAYIEEIYHVYKTYEEEGYVHYFNSTGILQHNDIGPQWHPTDVGHIKIASHIMQYLRIKFGWEFGATGPEVQHETLYWNDEVGY